MRVLTSICLTKKWALERSRLRRWSNASSVGWTSNAAILLARLGLCGLGDSAARSGTGLLGGESSCSTSVYEGDGDDDACAILRSVW